MMQKNYNNVVSVVSPENLNINWINAEYYRPVYLEIEGMFTDNDLKIKEFASIANISRVTGFEIEKYLELVEIGHPFLRVKNVKECFVDFSDMQYIPDKVHMIFKKSQFIKGDIALTITGRVGTAAIIAESDYEFNACQDVVRIRLNSNTEIDPYYLTIYLNSRFNYLLLQRLNSGASRPRTLINNVRKVNIPIPSPEIQKYIGDKVRYAEKLHKASSEISLKAKGIIESELELNAIKSETKAISYSLLNPDLLTERIDSGYYKEDYLRLISHLKSIKKRFYYLQDFVDSIYTGRTVNSNDFGEEKYFIQSGNISNNYIEYTDEKIRVNSDSNRLPKENDILFAKDGETIGKMALVTKNDITINEHTYCIRLRDKYHYYGSLIFYLYTNPILNQLIRREGTGSAQKGLNSDFIRKIIIPEVDDKTILNLQEMEKTRLRKINEAFEFLMSAKTDVEDLVEGRFEMKK